MTIDQQSRYAGIQAILESIEEAAYQRGFQHGLDRGQSANGQAARIIQERQAGFTEGYKAGQAQGYAQGIREGRVSAKADLLKSLEVNAASAFDSNLKRKCPLDTPTNKYLDKEDSE